jgi:hypothetical protein
MKAISTRFQIYKNYFLIIKYDPVLRLTYIFSYNLLHLIYISASLFMMMTLTNWYQPEKVNSKNNLNINLSINFTRSGYHSGGVEEIANGSMAIFWVKSCTAFFCQFLFLIIVIGRLYYKNRTTRPSCKWFINASDLSDQDPEERVKIEKENHVIVDNQP